MQKRNSMHYNFYVVGTHTRYSHLYSHTHTHTRNVFLHTCIIGKSSISEDFPWGLDRLASSPGIYLPYAPKPLFFVFCFFGYTGT